MAYTQGFKYDIFISYTHLDNHAPEGEQGWVEHFQKWLESWLARRFGLGKIEIWRDAALHGNTLFDERIPEVIQQSALFLALTSPHYFESDYCRKELQWFHRRAKSSKFGLSVGGEKRMYNILLKNIHHSKWPEELSGAIGFPMHDAPPDSAEPCEPLDHRELRYKKRLRKIVDAIEATLKAFPQEIKEDNQTKPKEETLKIFIADVADSLQYTKESLISDLKDSRVHIIDDIPPPMEHDAHESSATKAIAEADLSVHLLDAWPGRKITDLKTTTYPQRQVELGLKCEIPQLIWVPKSLDLKTIEDKRYADLLNRLETDKRRDKNYEFIREPKTELSKIIWQKIEEILGAKVSGDGHYAILLDTHEKDQRCALQLGLYLEEQGIKIRFNPEYSNPTSGVTDFEEQIKHVKNLVIVFGRVSPVWVHERVKKTIQTVATQF